MSSNRLDDCVASRDKISRRYGGCRRSLPIYGHCRYLRRIHYLTVLSLDHSFIYVSRQHYQFKLSRHERLSRSLLYQAYNLLLYSVTHMKNWQFDITSHAPHDSPLITYSELTQRNPLSCLVSLIKLDITINRSIKPREIRDPAAIYNQIREYRYTRSTYSTNWIGLLDAQPLRTRSEPQFESSGLGRR